MAPISRAHSNAVTSLAFSPDGKLLATGSADRTAKIWVVAETRLFRPEPLKHDGTIMSMAFSPNNQYLATACWDKRVRLWNVDSNSTVPEKIFEHKGPVMGVAFGGDDLIASVSLDKTVRLWRPSQGESATQAHQFIGNHGPTQLYGVAFSPSGSHLAVVGAEQKLVDILAREGYFERHSATGKL